MKRRIDLVLVICFIVFFVVNSARVTYFKNTQIVESFESVRSKITVEFAHGSENILLASKSNLLNTYLQARSLESKENIVDLFHTIMESNPRYDQIRYLNASGEEVIRLDRSGETVTIAPSNVLQDKSNRYYFLDTMKLTEGEIFVSPLDLNIENGEIEQPIKPTIRMATPVYREGEKGGMVIINYNASEILSQVIANIQESRPYLSIYLLNSDGYYLYHEDSSKTWGFMYAGSEDEVYYNDYPRLWNKITNKDSGRVFSLKDGMVFYNKIHPIKACRDVSVGNCQQLDYFTQGLSTRDYHLIVIGNASLLDVVGQIGYHIIVPSLGFLLGLILVRRLMIRKRVMGIGR